MERIRQRWVAMARAGLHEGLRLMPVVTIGAIVGLMVEAVGWAVAAALLAYLGWHSVNLYRLDAWLRRGATVKPLPAVGRWRDVFDQVDRLYKRSHKRKLKLEKFFKIFRESTHRLPDGAVVLSPAWEIQWVNRKAQDMFGISAARDVGQRIDHFLRDPQFIQYLRRGDFVDSVTFQPFGQTHRWVCVHIIPFARDLLLLIARDVTGRQRLDAVHRDFVANVSHELRTPLTVLAGFIETMQADAALMAEWQAPVDAIHRQTARMQRMVEDLLFLARLDFSAQETSATTRLAMPGLIDAVLADARALSGGRHRITANVAASLTLVGHEDQIRAALSNLVFNAVCYTPEGGNIAVVWARRGSGAVLAVQDDGDGIPAHHLARLTERFYRVDTARSQASGGTGLGLSIVKQVLDAHGACLDITSEAGVGSCFRCVFPTVGMAQSASPAVAGQPSPGDRR